MKKKFYKPTRKVTTLSVDLEAKPLCGYFTWKLPRGLELKVERYRSIKMKSAAYGIWYGASVRSLQKTSGLSLRRLKVLEKSLCSNSVKQSIQRSEAMQKHLELVKSMQDNILSSMALPSDLVHAVDSHLCQEIFLTRRDGFCI